MPDAAMEHGWQVRRFDQMAVMVNDRIDDPSEAGVDRYVGLEHLDSNSLAIRRWGSPDDVHATKLRFRSGDIIFGRRRAYQRKLAVADFDGICSAHAMVLRARPDVALPEFLPFLMQSDRFMERAVEISVGSLSPTINWTALAKEEFALPPVEQQRRIAELLQAAEGSIRAIGDLVESLEWLRKSLLVGVFDLLLNDDSVAKLPVARAGSILMGRQRAPRYDRGPSPKPYLRVANVFDGYIDIGDVKTMQFSELEFNRYRLNVGDILLNEGQSRELVGRSAIFRGEMAEVCFQNTLIRFRPEVVTPEFAHRFFQFCLYTGRFVAISKQTTSIAHLGVQRFAKMHMPVPNRVQQENVARSVSSAEERLSELKSRELDLLGLKSEIVRANLAGSSETGG